MDWLDLLAVQGTLKSLFQHHSSKASILWHSAFFMIQFSHPYLTTGKTSALTIWTFVGKEMSLLFNMPSVCHSKAVGWWGGKKADRYKEWLRRRGKEEAGKVSRARPGRVLQATEWILPWILITVQTTGAARTGLFKAQIKSCYSPAHISPVDRKSVV